MNKENNDPLVIAAFDFDGTISYFDTLIPYLWTIAGTWATVKNLFLSIPIFIRFRLNTMTRQQAKEALLTKFLKGKPFDLAKTAGRSYAQKRLKCFIKKKALEKIQWHRDQNHLLVLVSANLDVYLTPWAKEKGFQSVLSSQLDVDQQGNLTGFLKGKNCWGEEKVQRLQKVFGSKKNYILYAYGDSQGDQELLNMADYAFYRLF
ncbi:MAG: HAD-IB family hydrolase [Parachlamydiaceae bacterium]